MFVDAIERVNAFTRPVQSIVRLYGHSEILPGSATIFFVNELGCAITCRHVAQEILVADQLYKHYLAFQSERGRFVREKNYQTRLAELARTKGLL